MSLGPQRIACLSTEAVQVLYRLGAQGPRGRRLGLQRLPARGAPGQAAWTQGLRYSRGSGGHANPGESAETVGRGGDGCGEAEDEETLGCGGN